MLDSGANPNAYMKNGETTVLKLCEINNVEPLKLVINHKKNPRSNFEDSFFIVS